MAKQELTWDYLVLTALALSAAYVNPEIVKIIYPHGKQITEIKALEKKYIHDVLDYLGDMGWELAGIYTSSEKKVDRKVTFYSNYYFKKPR
jgi:hypothetical protein